MQTLKVSESLKLQHADSKPRYVRIALENPSELIDKTEAHKIIFFLQTVFNLGNKA